MPSWADPVHSGTGGSQPNEAFIHPAGRTACMDVRSRHHLRSDAISDIQDALREQLGVELDADTFEKVELTTDEWDVVLVDGEPHVLYVDDEPFLTVTGANAYPPSEHIVTVDAGAIEFVSNGADIMRPGIVEADEQIAAGDLVVINEETHGKSLAIGRAKVPGDDMVGDEGRVVESIHYVGDELYEFDV
jgi:PUA-domain protein